jgi:hypothetical protein
MSNKISQCYIHNAYDPVVFQYTVKSLLPRFACIPHKCSSVRRVLLLDLTFLMQSSLLTALVIAKDRHQQSFGKKCFRFSRRRVWRWLLCCCAVQLRRNLTTFRRCLLPPSARLVPVNRPSIFFRYYTAQRFHHSQRHNVIKRVRRPHKTHRRAAGWEPLI